MILPYYNELLVAWPIARRGNRRMISESETSRTGLLGAVSLDKTTIPQHHLNIEDKVRSNLFPWRGQFSPQFVHRILTSYATQQDLILDPFVGSGTVLAEADSLGLAAFGAEINPAAFQMSQAYRMVNINVSDRRRAILHVERLLLDAFDQSPLFGYGHDDDAELKKLLVRIWSDEEDVHAKILIATLVVLLDF